MSFRMDKELLIRMPISLYKKTKLICEKEYKSMSSLIRELIIERINESLTKSELASITKESKLFRSGKGIDWRKVKRG